MFQISLVRRTIRVVFFISLSLGFMLTVLSYDASAADAKPTQEHTGGFLSRFFGRTQVTSTSIQTTDPWWYDFNAQVAQSSANGPYILDRTQESELLADRLATSLTHSVFLLGSSGSGRGGVVEEFTRLNSHKFTVYRFNAKKLSLLNEQDGQAAFLKELHRLEQQNIDAKKRGDKQIVVFFDEFQTLLANHFIHPVDTLFGQMIAGLDLNIIVQTDQGTFTQQFTGDQAKYKDMKDRVGTVKVLPGQFESVLDYLVTNKAKLEAETGVEFTTSALTEAARLAVVKWATSPYRSAWNLAARAGYNLKTGRHTKTEEIATSTGNVRKDENLLKSLNDDLKRTSDPAEIDAINKRITVVTKNLGIHKGDLKKFTEPSSAPQKNAQLDLKIKELDRQLALLGPDDIGRPDLVRQIEAAHNEQEILMQDFMKSGNKNPDQQATAVTKDQILSLASRWLNIPVDRLSSNFEEGVQQILDIKETVIGQDHVIDAIDKLFKVRATFTGEGVDVKSAEQADRIRQGLESDGERAIATLWFAGPTGVGKTEVAKQLAKRLGYSLLLFNMTEFQQEHQVARMAGAPPGYKGYPDPGELIKLIQENPESVLVFDEIEKAHPALHDFIMQLLETGKIKDSAGNEADCRKCVIIMTSNLAQEVAKMPLRELVDVLQKAGWSKQAIEALPDEKTIKREVYKVKVTTQGARGRDPLRPDFFNRMDDVLLFNTLSREDSIKIARQMVMQWENRLKFFHDVKVRFSSAVINALVDSYNPDEGARSLRRGVTNLLRGPIAAMIIDNEIHNNTTIALGAEYGQVKVVETSEAAVAKAEAEEKANPTVPNRTAQQQANDALKAQLIEKRKLPNMKLPSFMREAAIIQEVFKSEDIITEHAFERLRR